MSEAVDSLATTVIEIQRLYGDLREERDSLLLRAESAEYAIQIRLGIEERLAELQRENAALREKLVEQDGWIAKSVGDLSSYAFNNYGGDAKLYNGIHALELGMEKAKDDLAEAAVGERQHE